MYGNTEIPVKAITSQIFDVRTLIQQNSVTSRSCLHVHVCEFYGVGGEGFKYQG